MNAAKTSSPAFSSFASMYVITVPKRQEGQQLYPLNRNNPPLQAPARSETVH